LPEATAARELREETGMTAASWERLPGFCMSPGILNEQMEVFIARGLTAGRADREPGEIIDNYLVSWDEALAMCRDGRIEDAKTLAAILRFQLTRP
jgi:ADP-ribose pyrophosphatase